jgi:hypothetical protein
MYRPLHHPASNEEGVALNLEESKPVIGTLLLQIRSDLVESLSVGQDQLAYGATGTNWTCRTSCVGPRTDRVIAGPDLRERVPWTSPFANGPRTGPRIDLRSGGGLSPLPTGRRSLTILSLSFSVSLLLCVPTNDPTFISCGATDKLEAEGSAELGSLDDKPNEVQAEERGRANIRVGTRVWVSMRPPCTVSDLGIRASRSGRIIGRPPIRPRIRPPIRPLIRPGGSEIHGARKASRSSPNDGVPKLHFDPHPGGHPYAADQRLPGLLQPA